MLDTYEKFRIQADGGKDFYVEVNWDPENPETNECKVLKFTFPDKSVTYVKKEYLHAILFAIGNEFEQRQLLPKVSYDVKWYETILSVKATKNIRKGESLTFPVKLSLPAQRRESIGPIKESKVILPK